LKRDFLIAVSRTLKLDGTVPLTPVQLLFDFRPIYLDEAAVAKLLIHSVWPLSSRMTAKA
jgi:hypothetical protein